MHVQVEQFVYCAPDASEAEMELMLQNAKDFYVYI